jgi:hypothetical protein
MPTLNVVVIIAFLVSSAPAVACNIGVFRYAVERWPADRYQVVVFYRGPLAADQALADRWRQACAAQPAHPNCSLELVDVSKPLALPLWELWQTEAPPSWPWLVVRYPESDENRPPVCSANC